MCTIELMCTLLGSHILYLPLLSRPLHLAHTRVCVMRPLCGVEFALWNMNARTVLKEEIFMNAFLLKEYNFHERFY